MGGAHGGVYQRRAQGAVGADREDRYAARPGQCIRKSILIGKGHKQELARAGSIAADVGNVPTIVPPAFDTTPTAGACP